MRRKTLFSLLVSTVVLIMILGTSLMAAAQAQPAPGQWRGSIPVVFEPTHAELGNYVVLEVPNEVLPTNRGHFEWDPEANELVVYAYGKRFSQRNDKGSFVFMRLPGPNVEVTARVVSRLENIPHGDINRGVAASRAGIMFRDSLDAGALRVMGAVYAGDHRARLELRNFVNGESANFQVGGSPPYNLPYWIRFIREGDTVRYYTSPDGEDWTLRLGARHRMTRDMFYVGFAVSRGDSITVGYDYPQRVVFDNITILR